MDTPMREAFADGLIEAAQYDPTIYVLDGDVANSTKMDRFFRVVPEQFVHCGIAEQNMAGVAAGMASTGLRPFVTTFAAFAVSRMLDQVRMVVAQTGLNVKVVGAYAGLLTGKTGKTHISVDDLAVYRAMPGIEVYAPGDNTELIQIIRHLSRSRMPAYLRVSRDEPIPIVHEDHRFELKEVVTVREGGDVMIVSTGTQSGRSKAAADHLSANGIDCALVHVPVLKPFPHESFLSVLQDLRPALIATTEEHNVIGGLGSAVAEVLASEGSHPPLLRLGLCDTFGESGANDDLLAKYGLGPREVELAITEKYAHEVS